MTNKAFSVFRSFKCKNQQPSILTNSCPAKNSAVLERWIASGSVCRLLADGLAESCFPLEKCYNTHAAVKATALCIILLAGVKPLMVQDISVQNAVGSC
jgi:hypothetical protein